MNPSWPELAPGSSSRGVLDGPAGGLEYRLELPAGPVAGAALICHPHPLYGGSMDNKVVYTLSRVALALNLAALRFQFRGVGQSAGPHDEGHGEAEDAAYLLDQLRQAWPDQPAVAMGFSFGAYMALKAAAARRDLAALVCIAPPLGYAGEGSVPEPACDWLIVHGREDEVVSYEDTRARAMAMTRTPDWVDVPGAGHFFHGQLGRLREAVEPWLAARL